MVFSIVPFIQFIHNLKRINRKDREDVCMHVCGTSYSVGMCVFQSLVYLWLGIGLQWCQVWLFYTSKSVSLTADRTSSNISQLIWADGLSQLDIFLFFTFQYSILAAIHCVYSYYWIGGILSNIRSWWSFRLFLFFTVYSQFKKN